MAGGDAGCDLGLYWAGSGRRIEIWAWGRGAGCDMGGFWGGSGLVGVLRFGR